MTEKRMKHAPMEAQTDFLTVLFIGSILFSIVSAWVILSTKDKALIWAILISENTVVEGEIYGVGVTKKRGKNSYVHIGYRFSSKNKHVREGDFGLISSTPELYFEGKAINVVFSPIYPSVFIAKQQFPRLVTNLIIFSIGLLIFIGSLWGIIHSIRKYRYYNRQKKTY